VKPQNDEEWAKFGRNIWDAAMECFHNNPVKVIVPIHGVSNPPHTVEVHPPSFYDEERKIHRGHEMKRHRFGVKMSSGDIKWGAWSRFQRIEY